MSDKPAKKLQDLSIAEQDALIERYEVRRDVRAANVELAEALRQWVHDGMPDYEIFNAEGHHGHYQELPERTLIRKLVDQGYTMPQIFKLADSGDTSLNYMSAEELEFVYQRITEMLDYFARTPSGTFKQAQDAYRAIGKAVRIAVMRQTGHEPGAFPTPDGKITGRESSKRFKPAPYRATLFNDEEGHDA